MNVTVIGNLSDNPNPANGLAGLYAEIGALGGDTNVTNLLVGGAGAAENNFVDGDPFNGSDVLLSRIAGAGTRSTSRVASRRQATSSRSSPTTTSIP